MVCYLFLLKCCWYYGGNAMSLNIILNGSYQCKSLLLMHSICRVAFPTASLGLLLSLAIL